MAQAQRREGGDRGKALAMMLRVSVYEGEVETECGTYTGRDGHYYNEMVQCGGKGGDSVS